ncbi:hypothetical protein JCM9534A_47080 [Catenuloplanes indicus JCM 9534]
MRDAAERQQVVLAERHHVDVADQHQLVVVGLERGGEHRAGVDPKAGEQFGVGAGDSGRGLLQPVPFRVLAERDEDLPDRVLDPGEVDGVLDGPAGELAVDEPCREIVQPRRRGLLVGGAGL